MLQNLKMFHVKQSDFSTIKVSCGFIKFVCSHSTQNVGTTNSRKYREAPHPELHFIKACICNGSEYVDSDIFILKGALKFALQISERFACCGNNKFYFVIKSFICNAKITLTKTITYIMKKSVMGKYGWDCRKGR